LATLAVVKVVKPIIKLVLKDILSSIEEISEGLVGLYPKSW